MHPQPETAVYLAGNDLAFGKEVASHNEHGRKTCGWNTGGSF